MKNKAKKIIMVLAVILVIIGGSRQAAAFEHGTTDKTIKENMLKDTPPADYQIDESMQGDAKDGTYNEYFLKDRLQTVSIDIDENNLNYLFQNAEQKPSVMTNSVTIGDKMIGYTGLKTKGNYTLRHTFTDNIGSDRFSFTINFGKYIKKKNGYSKSQKFYGCNKISFNNFFFDKSMMKEYIAMKLMTEMGLPTPQYGLAKLYINGGYYGVYFMVEALDSSILEQYFGKNGRDISDYITKPENTTLEYDTGMDKFIKEDKTFDLSSVLVQDAEGTYKAKGKLKQQSYFWEDDEDTLQDVAEMLPTAFGWQKKLSQLSKGTDFDGNKIDVNSEKYLELLSQVIDVDEALRYFATHSFLVQIDNMFVEQHNMGLYIGTDGKSMFLPWDYDLCFGCYYPSTAETTANMDIDLMYKENSIAFRIYGNSDGNESTVPDYSSFPFFQVIYQNSGLMDKYHQYMKDCSVIAALGGETSDNRVYKPGWFSSCISDIEEELLKAAGEELADNVYYLNRASQPDDVEFALPQLKQIIALRSLGVMLQVEGIDAIAGAYGCSLDALGNAMPGQASNTGNIAVIDADTGIYSIADYGNSWTNEPPLLTVTEVENDDPLYGHIKESLNMADTFLKVDIIINTGTPEGEHKIYIPAAKEENIKSVYNFTEENGLEEIKFNKEKNAYSVSAGTNACIAILYNGLPGSNVADNSIETTDKTKETAQEAEEQSLKWIMAAVLAVVIAVALVIVKKQKK